MTSTVSRQATARRGGKLEQAERAFVELLAEASRSGFYGSASLTIHVQDGHIQHVRVASERLLK